MENRHGVMRHDMTRDDTTLYGSVPGAAQGGAVVMVDMHWLARGSVVGSIQQRARLVFSGEHGAGCSGQ